MKDLPLKYNMGKMMMMMMMMMMAVIAMKMTKEKMS